MPKISILVSAFLSSLMLLPIVLAGPVQPPVINDTLYTGEIAWGPRRADPVRAYDMASGELLFNVYDTLISMGTPVALEKTWVVNEQHWEFSPSLSTNVPSRQEILMEIPDNEINLTNPVSYWFEPVPPDGTFYHVCGWADDDLDGTLGEYDVLYIGEYYEMGNLETIFTCRTWQVMEVAVGNHVLAQRFHYDFNIRTDDGHGNPIYFVNSTGDVTDTFDIYDAEYSFKRGLVQDQYYSPMWMYYKPLFDQMNSDWWDDGDNESAYCLSWLINDTIEVLPGNVLRINLGIGFPDVAFKQILCQSWGSILSKEWCISKGCWSGDLFTDVDSDGYPDWFTYWRHCKGTGGYSPIQSVSVGNYTGTGPYRVVEIDTSNMINAHVLLQRNSLYWRSWPAEQRKSYLEYVYIQYMAIWHDRKADFVECKLDMCVVPRISFMELLDPYGNPIIPEIKTIKNIGSGMTMDAIFYTFTVNQTSDALYTGSFPDGVPFYFMNNSHVRRAFSYALNHSYFLKERFLDEAICRETPNINGLYPDYYCNSPDPPWTYDYNLASMEAELKQAMFTQLNATSGLVETHSVWDWGGFRVKIYYNAGSERRIAVELVKLAFDQLSAQSGKSFSVNPVAPDWATYLDYMDTFQMPWWILGWLADFADADNWMHPFMHSNGDYAYYQNYTSANGWESTPGPRTGLTKDLLLDRGLKTTDELERADIYKDLDDIYITDCPSMPINQNLGRKWLKYWVKGWYYNPLYPGDYYYHLYKEDTCWADITGQTVGVPDSVVNMRDIGYICNRFGAKAPDTSKIPPYDNKWAPGAYGAGCPDVYSDRKIDMRDIGFVCDHFGDTIEP